MKRSAAELVGAVLPDGWVPTSAVVIVSAFDEHGEPHLFTQGDAESTAWAHIGMLTVALDDARRSCQLVEEDDEP